MKVITVVGARPQFVKLRPVSRALRRAGIAEFVLHTGQHFDYEMSARFFDELELPAPDENLGVNRQSRARQAAAMIAGITDAIERERPEVVIVFGDTTSTLAGALAANMSGVRVAHVEAGMRSRNREMPEELNRITADHAADLLFAPSALAVANLREERVQGELHDVGDVMYDVVLEVASLAREAPPPWQRLGVEPRRYCLFTLHRAENTASAERLRPLLEVARRSPLPIVFPVHPRTRQVIGEFGLAGLLDAPHVQLVEPLPFCDSIRLAGAAHAVVTDSGGLQKEAFYQRVPCVTLREETEWGETVELGWNRLVGRDTAAALEAISAAAPGVEGARPYGDGHAGEAIARILRGR
ncbi:MAG: UDP-N-acetylglucosamine 2-epimerase (non-hydrolyzing) [Acidobacteria bacterium]|nr:UDP-N-acetylglucosamine 2-epimerase (non-hydrolyzing) [Acidobacteriota bacterium]